MDSKLAEVMPFSAFAAQSLLQEAYADGHTSLSSVVPTSEQDQYTGLASVDESAPIETQHRSLKRRKTGKDFSGPTAAKLLRPQSHLSDKSVDLVSQIEDPGYESSLAKASTSVILRSRRLSFSSRTSSDSSPSRTDPGTDFDVHSGSTLVRLSAFKPSKKNVISDSAEEWTVILGDGDSLTIAGQYDLWVRKGSISLLGTIIHSSSTLHRVTTPLTHSLPCIRHVRNPYGPASQAAEVAFLSCSSRIKLLQRISKNFEGIWDVYPQTSGYLSSMPLRSFNFLRNSHDGSFGRAPVPLDPAVDWQLLTSDIVNKCSGSKIIMICGPKSSGKSTYARLLVNASLSKASSSPGIAFLDIDPGQPEFSPPGNITLALLKLYNLGPPFTHPNILNNSRDELIRAHHIGAITPIDDPHHYTLSVMDLFARYQQICRTYTSCSLVINCSGWILGSGLEILDYLIHNIPLTDIVYMSTTGPAEVTEVLEQGAKASSMSLHYLSSQPSQVRRRTAMDLRAMQTLSYFHLDENESCVHCWNATPVQALEPIAFCYAGPKQDFLGIMVLGEEISLDTLADVVDGSVFGLCVIEHDFVPLMTEDLVCTAGATYGYEKDDISDDFDSHTVTKKDFNPTKVENISDNALESDGPQSDASTYHPASAHSKYNTSVRRTKENLPYLFIGKGSCVPLEPAQSQCIGQVLVRGIDRRDHTLQVITPIPAAVLDGYRARGVDFVLVRGQLETPDWAYREESTVAMVETARQTQWCTNKQEQIVEDMDEAGSVGEEMASDSAAKTNLTPWITATQSERHRRNRVWKVRRNFQARTIDLGDL